MNMEDSLVRKHSVHIDGHQTSVSIEDEFWDRLRHIAIDRHMTLSNLVKQIDAERRNKNLSSALRLFVLRHPPQWAHEAAE